MTVDRDPTLPARRALTAICELSTLLDGQAYARASNPDMPGGDAMVCLAPVASPEAWQHRADTIERLWWEADDTSEDDRPDTLRDESDWDPPMRTIRFWSEVWRTEHDRLSDLAPTYTSEAKFLASVLDWAYRHEAHYGDFERDLRRTVSYLEAMLRAGEKDERSRVPCPYCLTDRDGEPIRVRLIRYVDPVVHEGTEDQTGGLNDEWNCPRCDRKFDKKGYDLARHQALIDAQTMTEEAG